MGTFEGSTWLEGALSEKYKVIYADCPWDYDDKNCNGAIGNHYTSLSVRDLECLPIHLVADKDCVLFLWATYPFLPEALRVISAWGFKYKSIAFQWVKLNPKSLTPFYGLGRWTRGNTEPCLLATRGSPHRVAKDVFQLVVCPRDGHSVKPPVVRDQIEHLMGDVPRLELFAREPVSGWDAMGYDIDGKDIRVALAEKLVEFDG